MAKFDGKCKHSLWVLGTCDRDLEIMGQALMKYVPEELNERIHTARLVLEIENELYKRRENENPEATIY